MIDPRYDYKELHTHRTSGILLPLFSLPSPYNIGSMGDAAYTFIDFLKEAGQNYWQLLPLGPTGYGNSPYSSVSSFAGNPYFIDLDTLKRDGELTEEETSAVKASVSGCKRIDYGILYRERLPLLKKAYQRFIKKAENRARLQAFLTEQADWLEDYALFSALRTDYGDGAWYQWPTDVRNRNPQVLEAARTELQENYDFTVFLQYSFQRQWKEIKAYANRAGVRLIGDLPIYCAHDSADVWAHHQVFCINKDGSLAFVGGCPPADFDILDDYGQVWGMPVYDWSYLEKNDFDWMIKRFKRQTDFYDVLRLDHFRGYESFWRIPSGCTGRNGTWEPAGGRKLFSVLHRKLPDLHIITEDLGYITKEVVAMRREFGYPSMRILQSGFNPYHPNEHTPHNYDSDTVMYFGIHDNEPLSVWLSNRNKTEKAYFFDYLNIAKDNYSSRLSFDIIKAMAASIADTVIYQVQDILFLGAESRINIPGSADGNWEFILTEDQFKNLLNCAEELAHITKLYGRSLKNSD